jgi:hypothetical protein
MTSPPSPSPPIPSQALSRPSSPDELRDLAPQDDAVDPCEREVLVAFLDEGGRWTARPTKRGEDEVILRDARCASPAPTTVRGRSGR